MSLPRLRGALCALPAYEPSEGVYSSAPPRLLSANESAYGPLPGITDAIMRAAAAVNRYPDPGCQVLMRDLARANEVAEKRVMVGAGSVALLQLLFQAISDPAAEAVYAWPSFELYPVLAELAGVASVRVPLAGDAHDLEAMAARITPKTRLVIVCNPNNPTGTIVSREDLEGFLRRVPPTCLIAIDEAYYEYNRAPGGSVLDLCLAQPNVVVLRTFSKAYGLAGLRVGYLLGDARVVAHLRKGVLAYSVNTVAQAAAVAALGLKEPLLRRVDTTVAERTRVRDVLCHAGWEVPDSQTNFLWLPLGSDATSFGRWCTHRNIAVRTFPGQGVRVTVGSAEDNDAFLAVGAEWRGQSSPTETGRRTGRAGKAFRA